MNIVRYIPRSKNEYGKETMPKKKIYLLTNLKIWIICLLSFNSFILVSTLIAAFQMNGLRYVFIVLLVLQIALIYMGYLTVYRKYRSLNKLFEFYTEGSLIDNFFDLNLDISPTIDKAFSMLGERFDKTEILNVSKKQAQYLALQNQINPHFLYNTLEGIRSEALCTGMEGVAAMTEALATFFRYTISNVDHLVTLEDELSNIENYYIIQQYRFGDKLNLSIEYDEEDENLSVLNFQLPKLILQPIVENSIYHGIERKIGKGNLRIRIDYTSDRLIIRISDDGMGMSKQRLEELNNKLLTNSMDDVIEQKREQKGGIAIINVNNRIKLLFGEEYGIYIFSTKGVGTDVEITLPIITE